MRDRLLLGLFQNLILLGMTLAVFELPFLLGSGR